MYRLATVLIASLVAANCTSGNGGALDPVAGLESNLLENPGFEAGRDPWFSLSDPVFALSSEHAHTGESSAMLQMRGSPGHSGARVLYVVQEIHTDELPEVLSGYYLIDHWERETELQYVQAVVVLFGATNLPGRYPNHQIRYVLTGIDRAPFAIENARFVFLGERDPTVGEWIHFQARIAEDFEEAWGAAPEGHDKIRVLFEVRYDGKSTGEAPEADVYYDDLYLGPELQQ